MALRTREDMEALIAAGQPVLFNGHVYTTEPSLPTQEEIDIVYLREVQIGPQGLQGIQGIQGEPGADGADGVVQSVNGKNDPDIVLDPDDLDDSATTNKFVTAANKTAWDAKQTALGFTAVPNTRQVNGHALSADVTVTKSDVGLSNVPNTDATNASNLSSGTVPDARFPSVLPAVSGANLTNLPASGGIDVQTFTANGTWTKPAGKSFVMVEMWGAGGGGSHTNTDFGGSGGGGGAYIRKTFLASELSATEAVVVGTGGTAGTNGNNGTASTFKGLTAGGGGGGVGVQWGGAGGSVGGSASTQNEFTGLNLSPAYSGYGGHHGASSDSGGGSGGGNNAGSGAPPGGSSLYGGGGGGGANSSGNGGAGGSIGSIVAGGGGAGGTSSGTAGGFGQGGGGTTSGTAGAGGVAGGGGGSKSGTGGAGGRGEVRVYSW